MRVIVNSRGMLAGLALLATVSVAACTAHPAGNVAAQPSSPAATLPAASAAPSGAPSATTGPRGIQNLDITSAERGELTAAFLARTGIPLSDVSGGGPRPGSVYYAYDPATATYWATADFTPVKGLSPSALEAFEGGGTIGMFRKAGAGSWQMQTGASSLGCLAPRFFPKAVLIAWSLPTAPRCMD
jgi:hypothetical protein